MSVENALMVEAREEVGQMKLWQGASSLTEVRRPGGMFSHTQATARKIKPHFCTAIVALICAWPKVSLDNVLCAAIEGLFLFSTAI